MQISSLVTTISCIGKAVTQYTIYKHYELLDTYLYDNFTRFLFIFNLLTVK